MLIKKMLRDEKQYIESLRDGRVVYYRGDKVKDVTTHRALRAAVNHASLVYKWQADNDKRGLTVYKDPENGDVSSFFKIPRSSDDLIERFNLIYQTTRFGRGTFNIIKAIGSDAIFALMLVTRRIDSATGSKYAERVTRFYKNVIKNDLAIAVAQTDVKGDRLLRPSEQPDPDMYVRIVERRKDGIVVRGAKAHTTQGPVSNEIIVLPTRAMTEKDADYAVAFAVQANAPGLKMISKPERAAEAAMNDEWFVTGKENVETESITIFDDVFVPWDRVFLAGEWQFAGSLAVMFPTYHRFTAISYRAGIADMFIGLGKLLAEYNGVDDKSHIRRDVVELIKYKEMLRSTAISSAMMADLDTETGIAIPNKVLTNVGKLIANESYMDVVKHLVDIAGGLAATLPASSDFNNPEEKVYLEKYLIGKKGTNAVERARIISTVKEIISSFGALYTAAMLHAEGSIEASVLELYRSYDYKDSKKLAMYASGISEKL
ncbi:MAG: 4-hydroxyphenylacetate 3-hydroxylase N-terminal domain-containing protein [Candidatus Micrarchaeaceae archaeon]